VEAAGSAGGGECREFEPRHPLHVRTLACATTLVLFAEDEVVAAKLIWLEPERMNTLGDGH